MEKLKAARLSWQCNYTRGDDRWSLRQLHALHQMLVENRDQLVDIASRAATAHSLAYEMEIALLVGDIHQHIIDTTKAGNTSLPGRRETIRQPAGVSLIYAADGTSLRYIIASLAASLAAGNVTILASGTVASEPLLSLLLKLWPRYLDPDCVFLLPGFSIPELSAADVDKILVHDRSRSPYNVKVTSPHVEFNDTSTALNLAIATGCANMLDKLSDEIAFMSSVRILPSERLHAVIVPGEHAGTLKQALLKSKYNQTGILDDREPSKLMPDVEVVDLTQNNMGDVLRSIDHTSSLVIFAATSLERTLDALLDLEFSPRRLAVLGSGADKVAQYIGAWLPIENIVVGSMLPAVLPCPGWPTSSVPSQTIFSVYTFSRVVAVHRREVERPVYTVKEIRSRYETLIPALAPDASGERLGFFQQVEYVIKGIGATIGLAAVLGVVYGIKRFRR